MKYEIVLSPEAAKNWRELKANIRAQVRDAIEQQLWHQPTRTNKSRLKRLRGLLRPQYRLRVGAARVFYDVSADSVDILVIVNKEDAEAWLEEFGEPDENGSAE